MDKTNLSEPNFKLEDIYKKHYLNAAPEPISQNGSKTVVSESVEDEGAEDRFDELFESILGDSDLYQENQDEFAATEGNPQDVNQTSPQDDLSQFDGDDTGLEDELGEDEGGDVVEIPLETLRPLFELLKSKFEGGEEDLGGDDQDVIPVDDDTDLNPDELPTEAVKNPLFPAPKRPPFKSRTKVKGPNCKTYPNERKPKKSAKSRFVKGKENWV